MSTNRRARLPVGGRLRRVPVDRLALTRVACRVDSPHARRILAVTPLVIGVPAALAARARSDCARVGGSPPSPVTDDADRGNAARPLRDRRADRRRRHGRVYKARDTRLDRTVAIKVLPADFARTLDRRAALRARGPTASAPESPAHLHAARRRRPRRRATYLVMEHLSGETLAERLPKGRCRWRRRSRSARRSPTRSRPRTAGHHPSRPQAGQRDADADGGRAGAAAKLLDFGLAKLRGHGEQAAPAGHRGRRRRGSAR